MLRMEELLDRLGADLAAPVDTLEEVGGCWVNRARITVLMFRSFFLCFLLHSQRTPDAELRSLSRRGGGRRWGERVDVFCCFGVAAHVRPRHVV